MDGSTAAIACAATFETTLAFMERNVAPLGGIETSLRVAQGSAKSGASPALSRNCEAPLGGTSQADCSAPTSVVLG